jgi:acyl-CoA reductase-like NAD-dependent aldehyde dehydrogenase
VARLRSSRYFVEPRIIDDLDTAMRAARTLRAGTVSVNAYSEGHITTPFGGFKESGFGGRDKGLEASTSHREEDGLDLGQGLNATPRTR